MRSHISRHVRMYCVALIPVSAVLWATVLAREAGEVTAGCSVSPVNVVTQGDAFGLALSYLNTTEERVGVTATHSTNIFFGSEGRFSGASVAPGTGVRQDMEISTIVMPIGIDFVTITFRSGGNVVGSCTFSLEILPVGTDPWQEATGPLNETNRIVVPVKWCAVKGSRLAAASLSLGWLDRALWARSGAASTIYLKAATGIDFRSAMMSDLALSAGGSFPIIDDPVPPAAGGIGQEGDIEVPYYAYETEKAAEMQAAIEACRQAWDQIEQTLGTNIEGVIAVNVRGLMFGGGITEHPLGLAMHVMNPAEGTAPCTQPGSVLSNDGSLLVTDRDIVAGPSLPPVDPHDRLVAHELGHVLFLGHGNGRDDDGNGQFDQFCDPQEDPLAAPFTIMHPERPLTTEVITQAQRATARPIAAVTTGAQRFNSPGVSVVVSDDRADTLGDAPDPAIDLTHVGISRNLPQHSIQVSHSVRGLLANSPGGPADRQFVMFLDTDGSAATGGSPALLGYTTTFSGAELVTAVTVTQSASGPTASGRVWQFSEGRFTEVDGIGIAASVETRMVTNEVDRFPVSDTVLLRMSDQIASNWPTAPRFQALAFEVGGTSADQVPDGAPGSASVLRLTPPRFPECSVTPSQPNPGDLVTLVATGLVADAPAAVFRGERAVATARTDGNGRGVFSFSVPAAAAGGTHPLTVGVIGSALTAHCRLAADASAPLLTVPTTVVADATSPSGTVVSYSVTAVDDVDPNPVVTCTPASGSLFPLLRTTVNCAATDASGKTATARFDVLVKDANLQLADLQELIRSWNVEGGSSLLDKLASVQRFLDAGKTRQACENLSSFKSQVNAQKGKTLTPQQATELLNRATRIATLLGC